MLSSQKDSVTIMTATGQTFILPFDKLSEEDVGYVKAGRARENAPKNEGGWLEDFEAAKKIAAAEKKPILVLFTGSDWCPFCIKLEKNVLDTDTFESFAKEELVRMMVDFPRKKRQKRSLKKANRALQKQYGVRGYPRIVLVDETGKKLSAFGYGGQPADKYVAYIKRKMP